MVLQSRSEDRTSFILLWETMRECECECVISLTDTLLNPLNCAMSLTGAYKGEFLSGLEFLVFHSLECLLADRVRVEYE